MPSVYEIDEQMLECVDPETGLIIDLERLEALQMLRDEKVEKVCLWYKNLCYDAEAYKKEKDVLAEKQRVAEKKAESLKEWIANTLAGQKFSTSKVTVSYRKSTTVNVDCDPYTLPEEYLTYKTPEPKKTEIKKALQSGEVIPGCSLTENSNINIK